MLTVVGSVCLSVCLHLTSRVFVRLTNGTTYLTGNEGQNICAVFSENASSDSRHCFFSLQKMRMRIIFDHVVESGHFVSRSVRRRSPVL